MRVLLVNNVCISDPRVGAVKSLRTIAQWLVEAGHPCRVLTTARFESSTMTIDEHLASLGAPIRRSQPRRRAGKPIAGRRRAPLPCPVVRYSIGDVPVTLLATRHHDESRPDRDEAEQYLRLFGELLREFSPDLLLAAGPHPMIRHALEVARQQGIVTVFTLRSHGYDDPRFYDHVDHVFTCSRFLSQSYRDKLGLVSTPIEPPLDWREIVADVESRAFVTFVNPIANKGVLLFARLAQMLGDRRPDIPILVIQSGPDAGALNRIPGIDFTKYPQIMAAPAVPRPADYFALTRILLVPSVWEEPFGRVAAEALINGIPPIVSNRGSLPDAIGGDYSQGGGGLVAPVPDWMTARSGKVPDAADVQPWFEAVTALWDDDELYARVTAQGREIAAERYAEAASRRKHVDYLLSCRPGCKPFAR